MKVKSLEASDRLHKLAGSIIIVLFLALLPSFCFGQEEKPLIHRILFEGNSSFKSNTLRDQMRSKVGEPEDSFQLARDVENVIDFYKQNGYLDAKLVQTRRVPHPKRERLITYTCIIQEGSPYTISSVRIEGAEKLDEKKLRRLLVIKPGQILKNALIYYSEFRIRELYAKNGYVYCKIEHRLETSPDTRYSRSLIFQVDEGNQVKVGSVTISGNKSVRKGIIQREIVIKPKEIFNPERAYESQRRIYGTGLFTDVSFDVLGAEEKKEVVDLVFSVTEGKPKWVAFGGGYQSPDRISAYLNWGHDNIFNNGQQLSLESSYSFDPANIGEKHEERFGFTHREPYLFNSSYQGQLNLFHHRVLTEFYHILETGGHLRIGRYMGEHIEAFAEYTFKTSSVEIFEENETTPEAVSVTNSVRFVISRDYRDNIFDPRTGTFTSFATEYAGGFLGGDNYFYRFIADASVFYNPLGSVVFALRARGGLIEPFAGRSTPFEERFALRGADAIRGYREQDLREGGNCLTTSNAEMRFPVFRIFGKYIGLAYFVDMGNAWRDAGDVRFADLQVGAGAGLRLETPIGPFRLDYARNITGRSETDLGRVYFGIGHLF